MFKFQTHLIMTKEKLYFLYIPVLSLAFSETSQPTWDEYAQSRAAQIANIDWTFGYLSYVTSMD